MPCWPGATMKLEYDNDLGSSDPGEQRDWDLAVARKSQKPRPPAEVGVCSFKDSKGRDRCPE